MATAFASRDDQELVPRQRIQESTHTSTQHVEAHRKKDDCVSRLLFPGPHDGVVFPKVVHHLSVVTLNGNWILEQLATPYRAMTAAYGRSLASGGLAARIQGKYAIWRAQSIMRRKGVMIGADDVDVTVGTSWMGVSNNGTRMIRLGTHDLVAGMRRSVKTVSHEYGHAAQYNQLRTILGVPASVDVWRAAVGPLAASLRELHAERFAMSMIRGCLLYTSPSPRD